LRWVGANTMTTMTEENCCKMQTLKKLLKLTKSAYGGFTPTYYGYRNYQIIKDAYRNGDFTVESVRYHDEFYRKNPEYYKYTVDTEPTYDKCIWFTVYVDEATDEVKIELTVKEGDLCDGYPTQNRAIYKLNVLTFVPFFDTLISELFEVAADEEFKRLERERLSLLQLTARQNVLNTLYQGD